MIKSITIELTDDKTDINSRLFSKAHYNHRSNQLILMIDLSELPPSAFVLKEGYLFIYMNEKENSCQVIYECNRKNRHQHKHSHPIKFRMNSSRDEGLKLFGEPQELNYMKKKNECLLFQYDPLFMEDMPLYQTLDGFVYIMLPSNALNPVDFSKAYVIVDRT
ncbi:MAG: hypothetical protein WDA09_11225 [Bacteriovoracaceae bacterium]|jgi:hypothetical protein